MKISTRDVPEQRVATGHRATGAPREVYGYDPAGGGPVCVALPVISATV
jgi:hypothetical protein